jgi:HK97 family phage major capsid protein
MNIAEQIRAFELKQRTALDRQQAIMKVAGDEGRSLDEEEAGEFDSLDTELAAIKGHIARLKKVEAADAGTAEPPPAAKPGKGPTIISRKHSDADPKFKGLMLVR